MGSKSKWSQEMRAAAAALGGVVEYGDYRFSAHVPTGFQDFGLRKVFHENQRVRAHFQSAGRTGPMVIVESNIEYAAWRPPALLTILGPALEVVPLSVFSPEDKGGSVWVFPPTDDKLSSPATIKIHPLDGNPRYCSRDRQGKSWLIAQNGVVLKRPRPATEEDAAICAKAADFARQMAAAVDLNGFPFAQIPELRQAMEKIKRALGPATSLPADGAVRHNLTPDASAAKGRQ